MKCHGVHVTTRYNTLPTLNATPNAAATRTVPRGCRHVAELGCLRNLCLCLVLMPVAHAVSELPSVEAGPADHTPFSSFARALACHAPCDSMTLRHTPFLTRIRCRIDPLTGSCASSEPEPPLATTPRAPACFTTRLPMTLRHISHSSWTRCRIECRVGEHAGLHTAPPALSTPSTLCAPPCHFSASMASRHTANTSWTRCHIELRCGVHTGVQTDPPHLPQAGAAGPTQMLRHLLIPRGYGAISCVVLALSVWDPYPLSVPLLCFRTLALAPSFCRCPACPRDDRPSAG